MTVSESEPESVGMTPSPLIASPTIPIMTETAIEISTQVVATLLESESFFSSSIAMNLKRICGIPKYPRPHARVEMIWINPYGCAVPVTASCVCVMEKYPASPFALSITTFAPPAFIVPKTRMIIRAADMMILCTKSVVDAARKPPSIV